MSGHFEYELLDNHQQVVDLREKLTELYATPFSDILWWELLNPSLIDNGYYKLFYYEQSVLKHIILFEYPAKEQKKIFVMNEEIKIPIEDIRNICRILFNEFDKVKQINFHKIFELNPKQSHKTIFEFSRYGGDKIIPLPETMDAYMKSLNKSVRKDINQKMNRITRDFSDFKVHYYENNDILLGQIEKLVLLHRDRMQTIGQKTGYDDIYCKFLHQYASTSGFGLLCVYTIDGNIVSGTINFVIGEHAYMYVISHDNLYNYYSIGYMTNVHTIKYLINKKDINYYHLLGGDQEYKIRLGGIHYDTFTYWVFRNYNLYYFWHKIKSVLKYNNRKYRKRLKANKTIYDYYLKLKQLKMKISVTH